ncbi:hypothetical protein CSB11_01070 [Candidatus Campbellbacteria bacterium]|nr:MAG: hypothetical protein CSB11_01070 [Candidatus Campbellbacteria bacterium]
MLKIHFHRNIAWYEFSTLDKDKLEEVVDKYQISPYVANKFIEDSNRNKVISSYSNLFVSVDVPFLEKDEFIKNKIKLILGKDYLISLVCKKDKGLEKFKANFDNGSDFYRGQTQNSKISNTFIYFFEKIYENLIAELKKIEVKIEEIEKKVFDGNERKMVYEISHINRKLIDFKKHIRSHDDFWESFFSTAEDFFDQKEIKRIEIINLSYQKTIDQLENIKDQLRELRDTNNSLLNVKMHRLSRIFTITTFSILPATLFITIITIPTKQKHLFLGHPHDFTMIIVISLIMVILMLLISKWSKW